ncbi:MAG TPA: type I DNA topoisomerase [Spirochaetia bacterium]|nr:type I DNA topoisomerase [Spirochaetia bacterium]
MQEDNEVRDNEKPIENRPQPAAGASAAADASPEGGEPMSPQSGDRPAPKKKPAAGRSAGGKSGSASRAAGARRRKQVLLIVESPAKGKTIEKYLGKGYTVAASMGHLIDLPKSRLAIDVENTFEPEYITVRGKAKILKDLKQKARKADTVLLASDNDREGEAISFHLKNALAGGKTEPDIQRITFNEITPKAIRDAVAHPGTIDMSKVNAQKARRILDRIVGYYLSPLLWKKVKNGLSAGRVQSVALRLICEREAEIEAFLPEEYWSLDAELAKGRHVLMAQLASVDGQKPVLGSEAATLAVVAELKDAPFTVSDIRSTEKLSRPRPPFTTSTLQQTAANRFGFTARKTMQIAQGLYEGVNIGSQRLGLITYMRTDSTRISDVALAEVREFIGTEFPGELPAEAIQYAAGKGAQDAHEAIRPTYVTRTPAELKKHLTSEEFRLYSIIWERFVSSQMNPSRASTTTVDITAGRCTFRASSTKVVEKGFQKALTLLASKEQTKALPPLSVGETLEHVKFHPEQHFTMGPPRYTDATIVKTLEEKGIGRPSTYAPIISVLLDRYYVVRKARQLIPTMLGKIINDMLSKSFPELLDPGFTASMEQRLDEVEEGKSDWHAMIKEFFGPFQGKVSSVAETLESVKGVMDEKTDVVCDVCGRPMVKKLGRYGFFLACTGFPECKNTKPVPLAACPRPGCGGQIVARKRKQGRGREFYGCTNYPTCDFVTYFKPTDSPCPKCGHFLVEKEDRQRGAYKSCINPECDYLHTKEADDQSA